MCNGIWEEGVQPASAGGDGAPLRAAHAPLRDGFGDARARSARVCEAQVQLSVLGRRGARAGGFYLPALRPSEALALLEERTRLLEEEVGEMRSRLEAVMEGGVSRVFLIENEHELVLREAELEWVRGLVREIEARELEGLREWEFFHQGREEDDE